MENNQRKDLGIVIFFICGVIAILAFTTSITIRYFTDIDIHCVTTVSEPNVSASGVSYNATIKCTDKLPINKYVSESTFETNPHQKWLNSLFFIYMAALVGIIITMLVEMLT